MYTCTLSVCMCLLLPDNVYTPKTKGDKDQFCHLFLSLRSHPSEVELTLVWGSHGACTHPGWSQGSGALLGELEEWLNSLGIL